MKELDFNIGAEVLCEGESCGRLAKLVVDSHTHRVTELVVEKGRLLKRDAVVPIDMVRQSTEEIVQLSIARNKLDTLPAYREQEFTATAGEPRRRRATEETLQRVTPSGMLFPELILPMTRYRPRERAPEVQRVAIERGFGVMGREGKLGTVDHVLIDRETGQMRLLVVDRGLFAEDVIVPANLVTKIGFDSITLDLDEASLEGLYRYVPRSDIDIMVELKEILTAVVEPESIDMDLQGGVLRLSGIVPDVRTKRRIEAAVRSVVGILDVTNDLDTATAIGARVVAALGEDRRTALSNIDVTCGLGIVTLRGEVDSPEIREAAAEVAASQQGVRQVVNELVVARDEESPFLRLGLLAECGVSFEESLSRSLRENAKKPKGITLPVEISETPEQVTIRARLAGIGLDDLDVQVAGNTLTLTILVKDAASEADEATGAFCRSIVLPSDVDTDAVQATSNDDYLELRFPKKARPTARKIDIRPT